MTILQEDSMTLRTTLQPTKSQTSNNQSTCKTQLLTPQHLQSPQEATAEAKGDTVEEEAEARLK